MHIDVTIKASDRLKIVNVSVVYDKTGRTFFFWGGKKQNDSHVPFSLGFPKRCWSPHISLDISSWWSTPYAD